VSHVLLRSKYGVDQGFREYDQSLVLPTNAASEDAISSSAITEKAIAFLNRQVSGAEDKPWFLMAHYFDPHYVYQRHEEPPQAFGDRPVDLYDGEIVHTDAHIGRLLAALEALGLADNTIVVLMADHGEEFWDHGRDTHGKTLYREVVRVPLGIRVPGMPARRVKEPMSLVDLMPTLLELLGITPPDIPMAGRSVSGLMRGEPAREVGVLLESRLHQRKDVTLEAYILGGWKIIVETQRAEIWAEQGGAGTEPPKRAFLFNLEEDPDETEDLSGRHPEIVRRLQEKLAEAVGRATAAAEFFGSVDELHLSAEEIERLQALGYVEDESSE
jgi:arylsulfatase A-like enzyme